MLSAGDHCHLGLFAGDHLKKRWRKALPVTFSKDIRLAVGQAGQVLLHSNDITHVFDDDLQLLTSHAGHYGHLKGVINMDRVVYAKHRRDRGWVLDLLSLDKHERLLRLRPPGGRNWNYFLSVAADELTGWMAVAALKDHSLEIYTPLGWYSTCQGVHVRYHENICRYDSQPCNPIELI